MMDSKTSVNADNGSALGLFLAGLVLELSLETQAAKTASKKSVTFADPPVTIAIVQDRAKVLKISDSLSVRRTQKEMRLKRRKRARAFDAKKMSRWDSYPYTTINRPCREQAQDCCLGHQAFVSSSSWLKTVAENASYKPKPAARVLSSVELGDSSGSHERGTLAPHTPVRRAGQGFHILRSASLDSSVEPIRKSLAMKDGDAEASRRAAPPSYPRRKASLQDVNFLSALSIEDLTMENEENASGPHPLKRASRRGRRGSQSDHTRPTNHHGAANARHHRRVQVQPVTEGDSDSEHSMDEGMRILRAKHAANDTDDDDATVSSCQDTSVAELTEICARSA